MRRSLFSPLWYRVAGTHPRLHVGVRVERQRYRDQIWYLLIDDASGRHFRMNEKAYQFIGRCDGSRTVQEVWDSLFDSLRDETPTQDEVIALLGTLSAQGLIYTEATPDAHALIERAERRKRARRSGLVNPFAFRIPLGDPWSLIAPLGRLASALFHPATLVLWLVTVALGCAAAAANWNALSAHAATYLGSGPYLLLTWLSFPFIKALHELSHGLAVRRWGGEVHEAGVTLFMLVPAPYVDASQSAGFHARYQRVLVGAAGVMCEVFIAACALFVWLAVEPGTIRNLAFVTMVTASVSTLFFNGNPLLKFDAYYVLCDLLDIPNLAARSGKWWGGLLRSTLTGRPPEDEAQPAQGETKWLVLYGPLAAGYRILISGAIVLWIGSKSAVLGMAAAIFVLVTVVGVPLFQGSRTLVEAAPPGAGRWRARTVVFAGAAAFAAALCVVPLPLRTAALGVVWLPEQARVRAETDGFVAQVLANDAQPVRAGMVLMRLEDPALIASQAQLVRRREELDAERFSAMTKPDLARVKAIDEDIVKTDSEIARAAEKIAQLEVKSGADGTLVMPRQQDLPGAFAKRGANLGYVLNRDNVLVRAAVREEDAALVRELVTRIAVRIAGAAGEEYAAEMVRDIPAATRDLPSAALGERGGGPYPTDPADKDGLKLTEPVVLIDLKLPAAALERVGARAWVLFDHGAEPLVAQLYRRTRQLLLRHFNPAG